MRRVGTLAALEVGECRRFISQGNRPARTFVVVRLFLEWLQLLLIFVKPGCVGVDQAMFWAPCRVCHVRMGAHPCPHGCSARVLLI